MALDITAYCELTPAPDAPRDVQGCANYREFFELSQTYIDSTERLWPGSAEGLSAGVFRFGRAFHFRAGSYSNYNWWRDQLSRMAHELSAHEFWLIEPRAKVTRRAFVELIDFSDCEGIIGPVVADKLARDFA